MTPAAPTIATTQQPTTAPVGSSVADKATVTGGGQPDWDGHVQPLQQPERRQVRRCSPTPSRSPAVRRPVRGTRRWLTGTDYWVATYNGDANNNSVTSGATLEPVVITAPAANPPGPPRPQRPPRGRCRLSLIPT